MVWLKNDVLLLLYEVNVKKIVIYVMANGWLLFKASVIAVHLAQRDACKFPKCHFDIGFHYWRA